MDSIPIFQISAPKGEYLDPLPSSQPIETTCYELRPSLIAVVRAQSFAGIKDENPYAHLREFEQNCSIITIPGMPQDTLKWKLFPFSLMGLAKKWHAQDVGSVEGSWEALKDKFYFAFFPINKIVDIRIKVFTFSQGERESLGAAWARSTDLVSSGPDVAIPEPMLM